MARSVPPPRAGLARDPDGAPPRPRRTRETRFVPHPAPSRNRGSAPDPLLKRRRGWKTGRRAPSDPTSRPLGTDGLSPQLSAPPAIEERGPGRRPPSGRVGPRFGEGWRGDRVRFTL
ncbi:hypothetical protein GCM10009680_31600 [Streptomyces yatensis]|uniref:Uncharacterized protein n=1 Tax=Streptomyces yatensis TaxID=155177 RepID=A0ABP4TMM7_9ACTN